MKLLLIVMLAGLALLLGLVGISLALVKLDQLTGRLADFNTLIVSAICLALAAVAAVLAGILTEGR